MSDRIFIFLDESGNLDFSLSGSRYFVLTCVTMRRPFQANAELDDYKYDCIEYGLERERFHCSEDNQHVRQRVFEIIGNHLDNMRIDSLVVEKSKTGPSLRAETQFYPRMLGYLLRYVLNRASHVQAEETVIVTDTIPLKRRRRAIERAVKLTLANMLTQRPKYRILHHDSRSHYGLQVADYCSWAIFRKWERSDTRSYELIQDKIASEFDLFQPEDIAYY